MYTVAPRSRISCLTSRVGKISSSPQVARALHQTTTPTVAPGLSCPIPAALRSCHSCRYLHRLFASQTLGKSTVGLVPRLSPHPLLLSSRQSWFEKQRLAHQVDQSRYLSGPSATLRHQGKMPVAQHELRPAELVTDHLETPSLDDRTYRVIRLPNQLEALIVHDAKTDKASAAMDVNVGSFSDDASMPGMAHAVEHVSKSTLYDLQRTSVC